MFGSVGVSSNRPLASTVPVTPVITACTVRPSGTPCAGLVIAMGVATVAPVIGNVPLTWPALTSASVMFSDRIAMVSAKPIMRAPAQSLRRSLPR